tara:strand:+ start:139 stop:1149 length:1011 start_codon:yes stop_codon:yes gene_type:complete
MSLLANNSILQEVIGQKLNKLIAPQKPKGLLGFAKSQYAQDLGTGLLAQSGYQPMPTSLGQSIGTAFQNANQLENQRRMTDFSELGALTNIYGALNPTGSKTDNSWQSIQSYAKDRGIELTETQAKEVTRNIGTGNIIRIDESTGTAINTLDVLLKPYLNKNKNKDAETDSISLSTGETELQQENIYKKVEGIQEDFNKYNWNELIFVADEIDKIINQGGNIKGVGVLEGNLPDLFVGEEGKLNKAKIARLFNITLKDRSGSAVTTPELDRLKKEFGAGTFKTDQDFINAFNVYKGIVNKIINQQLAGYDSRALETWTKQGGVSQIGSDALREEFL